MQNIRDLLTELTDINMNNVSDQIVVTMAIIVGLLVVASFFSLFVSIYLAIAYAKYNRTKNTCGKNGEEAARLVLDNKFPKTAPSCLETATATFSRKYVSEDLPGKRTA